jgi:RNA polymerase sigma-70 factor (ECF subfamily)
MRPVEPFDAFFRRELPALVALARALCGPAHADDAAQEAMLVAYRRWPEVAGLDRPDAWVRKVLVNLATSVLRRRAAEARAVLRLGSRPAVYAELEPRNEQFWEAVRRLPRRQAQVVALHYVDDLGVAEIADLLGVAEGSVKQHLSRARSALARTADRWGEGER